MSKRVHSALKTRKTHPVLFTGPAMAKRFVFHQVMTLTKLYLLFAFVISCVWILSAPRVADATEIIKFSKPHHEEDPRLAHPLELLKAALSKTEAKYGPYEIEFTFRMDRDRALKMLINGDLSVHDAPTQAAWEEKVLTVRVPIMKGLNGYRLFLINRDRLDDFSDIRRIEQLKELRAGVGFQWSITKSLQTLGFSVVKGDSYLGLFAMLSKNRFDYFPRGINEIFGEYELHKPEHPEMVIEPTKALYIGLPIYFFVSPKKPHLAQRIEEGLMAMREDGSFDELFYRHCGDAIRKAELSKREVFVVKNPKLPTHPIYDRPEFWFSPGDLK